MEDVQVLMNKMENLDKEVNDLKEGLVSLVTAASSAAPTLAPSTCNQPNNRLVRICCTTVLPVNLGHIELNKQTKFIYSTNCLTTAIERCNVGVCEDPTLTVPIYKVKVVGCIPFAFSAVDAFAKTPPDNGKCGNFPAPANADPVPKTVDICCHGSVCVNNAICCQINKDNALAVADLLKENLNCAAGAGVVISAGPAYELVSCTCSVGTPTFNKCENEYYVKFTVTIQLPPCPALG